VILVDKTIIAALALLFFSIKVIVKFYDKYGTIGVLYGILYIVSFLMFLFFAIGMFGFVGAIITAILFFIVGFILTD
jgi:hypothetical protein